MCITGTVVLEVGTVAVVVVLIVVVGLVVGVEALVLVT
jgi:hypothetical protein